MRTVTVKEAAEALGLTTRAIVSRLNRGDLKGTQKQNAFGVKEWRIYPTKEIAQKLRLDHDSPVGENDFPAMETIDAETISEEGEEAPVAGSWMEAERGNLRVAAEEMMRPLLETIRQQERQLQEQSRQIKLIPNFEKEAEEVRKLAEAKAFEAEALAKQIAALQSQKAEAEQAKEQIALLEKTLAERELEKDAEIERLKTEKDAQLKTVEEQLAALAQTVQELKTPWWRKMLGISAETESKPSATSDS